MQRDWFTEFNLITVLRKNAHVRKIRVISSSLRLANSNIFFVPVGGGVRRQSVSRQQTRRRRSSRALRARALSPASAA